MPLSPSRSFTDAEIYRETASLAAVFPGRDPRDAVIGAHLAALNHAATQLAAVATHIRDGARTFDLARELDAAFDQAREAFEQALCEQMLGERKPHYCVTYAANDLEDALDAVAPDLQADVATSYARGRV